MKRRLLWVCAAAALLPAVRAGETVEPVEVRVRATSTGPRIFVDGRPVAPRFYYGSPPCLVNISWQHRAGFVLPFRAPETTREGRAELKVYDGEDGIWFSNPCLVDRTTGAVTPLPDAAERRTKHFAADGLALEKDHVYWLVVTNRAAHSRTYFTYEASYRAADGLRRPMPLPYGETLAASARCAGEAGVDFVTFSTDNSWGCRGWWAEPGADADAAYARIDAACAALIAANPRVLLVPRVVGDAPPWFLARHPEAKMKFGRGFTIDMSSVAYRPYRAAVCAATERLVRHLRARFPRNFAGLHVSGQNSAEWFYMMSQSGDLSGYDVGTRDAFRAWLARKGDPAAATAEVPSVAARTAARPGTRFDPVKDARVRDFVRFRQEDMASLLNDIGAAIRRGSDGKSLALFFYGYSWELGANRLGPGETGHYALSWLMEHGRANVDGFSSPLSYSLRGWPGGVAFMGPIDTVQRKGFLWINEDDNRTHHEDIWDHCWWAPHTDPFVTRNNFLRDGAVQILRGYGDWWMDLMGRGWFRDARVWDVRRALAPLENALARRTRPYSPEIAAVVDEESFLDYGCGSSALLGPVLSRQGFATCGATYGQYFLDDILENPLEARVYVILVAADLPPAKAARLAAFKAARPAAVFVENPRAADLTAEALAAALRRAGGTPYVAPGRANLAAAEGFAMLQALEEGPLEIDFGASGEVVDFVSGVSLGRGPRRTVPFKKGETRIFRTIPAE